MLAHKISTPIFASAQLLGADRQRSRRHSSLGDRRGCLRRRLGRDGITPVRALYIRGYEQQGGSNDGPGPGRCPAQAGARRGPRNCAPKTTPRCGGLNPPSPAAPCQPCWADSLLRVPPAGFPAVPWGARTILQATTVVARLSPPCLQLHRRRQSANLPPVSR